MTAWPRTEPAPFRERPGSRDRDAELVELNRILAPLERRAIERYARPRWPTVFVVGAPRSGHTLLSQVLAATGGFGYITNLMARFWEAPSIAARIERALEAQAGADTGSFTSVLGATPSWSGPHEGGNFLRRWIPFSDTHRADIDAVEDDTASQIRREVSGLEDVYRRPIFLRNLVYGLNLDLVRQVFDDALVVHCVRDVVFQAQSILIARERIAGDRNAWWSLRPAEYHRIVGLPAWEQVVAQIYYTRRAVEAGSAGVPISRRVEIRYEELAADPRSVAGRVLRWVESCGGPAWSGTLDRIPRSLGSRNVTRLGEDDLGRLRAAAATYFGEGGPG